MNETLIDVQHVSLNHGDLHDAKSWRVPSGGVLGSHVFEGVGSGDLDGRGPFDQLPDAVAVQPGRRVDGKAVLGFVSHGRRP